jgi:hypothetical protein
VGDIRLLTIITGQIQAILELTIHPIIEAGKRQRFVVVIIDHRTIQLREPIQTAHLVVATGTPIQLRRSQVRSEEQLQQIIIERQRIAALPLLEVTSQLQHLRVVAVHAHHSEVDTNVLFSVYHSV